MRKNEIIALSGEPVSGKGTTVKALIQKLEERGYSKENIHIESTGNDFRRYFQLIVEFIKNFDKEEIPVVLEEDLKQFFSHKDYREIMNRAIASIKQSGMKLDEFTIADANNRPEFGEIRKLVDDVIDKGMKEKGKKINQIYSPKDIWIIDSRLAFHNIPEAFSVRLTTNIEVAGKRLFNDTSRGKEDKYKSIEEAKMERENRRKGEKERYLNRYGVDLENPDNYDLIVDTSYASVDEVADTILTCEKLYKQKKDFAKTWASPQCFLPLQSDRQTYEPASFGGVDLETFSEVIKTQGYDPSKPIEVIQDDSGAFYIIEGHHRNFGSAMAGKTLVPYNLLAKGNEEIPKYRGCTANQRVASVRTSYLFGHEHILEDSFSKYHPGTKFSYTEVYPDIYEKENDNVR